MEQYFMQTVPAWPQSKKAQSRGVGQSVFYSWSQDFGLSPAIWHPCDLLLAEMHSLNQILERCDDNPVLWIFANFYEPAKKMSKLKNNEENCSMHSAFSTFAQLQRENSTQVDN